MASPSRQTHPTQSLAHRNRETGACSPSTEKLPNFRWTLDFASLGRHIWRLYTSIHYLPVFDGPRLPQTEKTLKQPESQHIICGARGCLLGGQKKSIQLAFALFNTAAILTSMITRPYQANFPSLMQPTANIPISQFISYTSFTL